VAEPDAVVDLHEAVAGLDHLDDDEVVAVADGEAGGLVGVVGQRTQRGTGEAPDLEALGGADAELEHRQPEPVRRVSPSRVTKPSAVSVSRRR
jgi:hypothetical protein